MSKPSRCGPEGSAGVARRAISSRTVRQYEADWAAFRIWCRNRGVLYLPAVPAVVAAYLAERSATRGCSGLRSIVTAIAHHHRQAGQPWNSGSAAIVDALRRIGRKPKRPVRPAAALTSAELRRLLAGSGDDLAGVRDRALLLVGFAGALRRSELVALDHEDVRFTTDGVVLDIRSRKLGQGGRDAGVGIGRSSEPVFCPVRALEAWLRQARIEYGPVFRRLTAAGTVEGRLTGNGVWKVLRHRAEAAGFTVAVAERLSPQGLRAGAIAEARQHKAPKKVIKANAGRKKGGTVPPSPRRRPARPG